MTYQYKSILKDYMLAFEELRLNFGYSESTLYYLKMFDKFLVENKYTSSHITKGIIDLWAVQKETENKNSRNHRVSSVKQFCLYLNALGVEAFVPNYHFSYEKPVPYVLTEEEIQKLFESIDNLFENVIHVRAKHYRFMVPILIRLLYVTGLRNNEACSLRIDDLNADATLTIHNAKNKKDRIVYLSNDIYLLLKNYIKKRDKSIVSDWLFPSGNKNKHILKTTIDSYFHRAVVDGHIGNTTHYPTPHSLRHTYVVHLVDTWLNEEKNLNDLMPYLSKQLGHTTTEETYYYYHMLCSSYEAIDIKKRNLFPEVISCEEE